MADAEEDPKLLAGHAPAMKVGGMRVAPPKHHKEKEEEEKPEEEDTNDYGSEPKVDKHHQQLLVSGAVTKGDKDFPPEAIKVMHEKPQPTHINRPSPNAHMMKIQQPRKQ